MFETHIETAQRLAERAQQFDFVEAVAISGSIRSGMGNAQSDVDTYLYITRDITDTERDELLSQDVTNRQRIDYWGASDYFTDAITGIEVDCMYFRTDFIQDQVERVLIRHEASMGYTTAFLHTVKQSLLIYDRNEWFAKLQEMSNQPYPEPLRHNIVALNFPLLGDTATSYRAQIAKAVKRSDFISVNHRLTAFLASYFDILFAVNRLTHPGEKRLLKFATQCEKQPKNMIEHLNTLLKHKIGRKKYLAIVDQLIDEMRVLLEAESLI